MNNIKSLLGVFLWIGLEAGAQPVERVLPMAGTPSLSGSFGELRATHLHAGVDFRTGGRTGLPVRCVDDGIVARVNISAGGYGQALYIEHPDGVTSVYAHLARFHPRVEALVREIQYREERFEIDEEVKTLRLFFRKGDTIAWSGNTGSSGGPHLHFEYRNTLTEMALDPLYYIRVRDQIAPVFHALYLYRADGEGREERVGQLFPRVVAGNTYRAEAVRVPAGKIGIGAWITDAMNGSSGKLGVHTLEVTVDGEPLFVLILNRLSFDRTELIHALKDFSLYTEGKTVYRCFGRSLRELAGVRMTDDGWMELAEGAERTVEVKATDRSGNIVRLRFQVIGLPAPKPKSGKVLKPGCPHRLAAGRYSLFLDSAALFSAVDSLASVDPAGSFVVSETVRPLKTKGILRISGVSDPRTVICRFTEKGKREALRTFRDSAGMYALVGTLGKFTYVRDTVPPVIEYTGVSGGTVRIRIKDDCAGIDTYRVEANGEWMLFEYDAKTATLAGDLRDSRLKKGQTNRLVVSVTDRAGNKHEKRFQVPIR
ncbi:MAG: M23 family metallopeptidase [Culturomica sp.]|nr:M23 family metallopeptidase [Culturomica sp.]